MGFYLDVLSRLFPSVKSGTHDELIVLTKNETLKPKFPNDF